MDVQDKTAISLQAAVFPSLHLDEPLPDGWDLTEAVWLLWEQQRAQHAQAADEAAEGS